MRNLLFSSLLVTLVGSFGCAPPDDGSFPGGHARTDKDGAGGSTGGGSGGEGGGGAGGGSGGTVEVGGLEITAFASDLILTMTANDNLPTTTEDKKLVDVSPIAFGPSFFP